jgi:hypothetical protein
MSAAFNWANLAAPSANRAASSDWTLRRLVAAGAALGMICP